MTKKNGPVRRGKTYCSAWCGGGCTWLEYQAAKRRAERLAKRLGPTWQPGVWENLGWYASASLGFDGSRVNVDARGNYTFHFGSFYETGRDPRDVIRDVLQQASSEASATMKRIELLAESIGFEPEQEEQE